MPARANATRLPAILLVTLTASCDSAPPRAPLADLRSEVSAVVGRYAAAVEARDSATLREVFVDDDRLVWLEQGEVRYRSVDDMLSSLASFPPETSLVTRLEGLEVVPAGTSSAHAWARFETTVGEGPESFSFDGVLSLVLERTERGWRVVGGHRS